MPRARQHPEFTGMTRRTLSDMMKAACWLSASPKPVTSSGVALRLRVPSRRRSTGLLR